MSKAENIHAPLTPNRRSILTGAGGVAAAGALAGLPSPATAAGVQFSPEFLEYRQRHAAWLACFVEPYEEDEAWEVLSNQRDDARWEMIRAILERRPRTWQDVVELAHVVRMELWEDDLSGTHSEHGDLEPALMKAIFAVAEGGQAHA